MRLRPVHPFPERARQEDKTGKKHVAPTVLYFRTGAHYSAPPQNFQEPRRKMGAGRTYPAVFVSGIDARKGSSLPGTERRRISARLPRPVSCYDPPNSLRTNSGLVSTVELAANLAAVGKEQGSGVYSISAY